MGSHVDVTYGEWTVQGLHHWLNQTLRQHANLFGPSFETSDFVDFGSGRGMATLVPWMDSRFRNAVGIEAVDVRFRFACSVLSRMADSAAHDTQLRRQLSGLQNRSIRFFHSDFDGFAAQMGDVVGDRPVLAWASSLCFSDATLRDLQKLTTQLPPRSLLVTTKPLLESSHFQQLSNINGDMSWRNGTKNHVYQRTTDAAGGSGSQQTAAVEDQASEHMVKRATDAEGGAPRTDKEMCGLFVPADGSDVVYQGVRVV